MFWKLFWEVQFKLRTFAEFYNIKHIFCVHLVYFKYLIVQDSGEGFSK